MRVAHLSFAPFLLAACVLTAQQTPVTAPTSASSDAGSQANSSPMPSLLAAESHPPQKADDPISREEAKAAQRAQKDQAKADAKAQKDAEKEKKQEEADAKLLKLEDNEIAISVFDDQGNPVKIPPCSKKDKECQEKRKEILKQKRVAFNVQNGSLSIDGLIARVRLNYDIRSYLYLYLSVPGYGTIVTSPVHFPHSTEVKNALDGSSLAFQTEDGHFIELASEKSSSGHGKRSIFYAVDTAYQQPGRYPTIGYGTVSKAPYVWPGAAPLTEEQKRRVASGPALPNGMAAEVISAPCQAGSAGSAPGTIKSKAVSATQQSCKAAVAPGAVAPTALKAATPVATAATIPTATTLATVQEPSR